MTSLRMWQNSIRLSKTQGIVFTPAIDLGHVHLIISMNFLKAD